MRLPDFDLSKESAQIQELADNLRSILNNGAVEFEVTFGSTPGDAPEETKIVLSLYGAQYRLYISYLGDWYYVALTKV